MRYVIELQSCVTVNMLVLKNVKETAKDELIAMMVGRTLTNYYVRDYGTPGEEILKVVGLSDGDKVNGVDLI